MKPKIQWKKCLQTHIKEARIKAGTSYRSVLYSLHDAIHYCNDCGRLTLRNYAKNGIYICNSCFNKGVREEMAKLSRRLAEATK